MQYLRGEINDVQLTVVDAEAYAKYGGGDSYLDICIAGKALMWIYGRVEWGDVFKVSEYRNAEVDFAVPQSFYREHGPGYVWYYSKQKNGGYGSGCALARADILESARKMVENHHDWIDLVERARLRKFTQNGWI